MSALSPAKVTGLDPATFEQLGSSEVGTPADCTTLHQAPQRNLWRREYRDGAAVQFEGMWMLLGYWPVLSRGALAVFERFGCKRCDVGGAGFGCSKQTRKMLESLISQQQQQHTFLLCLSLFSHCAQYMLQRDSMACCSASNALW